MANTSANVRVGKPNITGGVYSGATSVTLPTNATTALGTGIVSLGYVSESGLVQTIDSESTPIVAWGGDTVRTVRTSHDVSYALEFLETSEAVLTEVFGEDFVTVAAGVTTVELTSVELPRRVYVFEMKDGDHNIRIVVPSGQIALSGDVSYVDGEAVRYPVTISAFPDASGVKAYQYIETDAA